MAATASEEAPADGVDQDQPAKKKTEEPGESKAYLPEEKEAGRGVEPERAQPKAEVEEPAVEGDKAANEPAKHGQALEESPAAEEERADTKAEPQESTGDVKARVTENGIKNEKSAKEELDAEKVDPAEESSRCATETDSDKSKAEDGEKPAGEKRRPVWRSPPRTENRSAAWTLRTVSAAH
ncbi:hypothetical protein WMY93_023025 [Mugilogobius chulae]|uniref:Myristoylated alanine-rich C-kinase substrate n=1 Tax=Mugilogobius chulae TaxID=88201 RepID=A0AAW0NF88_9GOBI